MTNYDILKEYEAHQTPVPSYEELVKLKEELKDYEYEHKQYAMSYEDTFCKLETARKENKQLKELLKECKKILCESQTTNPIVYFRWENDLINKIDEALK